MSFLLAEDTFLDLEYFELFNFDYASHCMSNNDNAMR